MTDQNQLQEIVFACDISALTPDQREHHGVTSKALFAGIQEVRETSNGYAFRVSSESATLTKLADFITFERLCCPFFAFNVEVEPQSGPVWIGLSGDEGVKAFIIAELGWLLNDNIAAAAGFR
ncbi:MAG: hypothetical protein IPK52_07070 [Chloroflexi bacterium]|nr:hypothetical protein [Chloroflexota bacterium]